MTKVIYFDYHGVLDQRTFEGMLEVIARAANPVEASRIVGQIRQVGYDYAIGRMSAHRFWHHIEHEFGQAASRAGRQYILHVEPILDVWKIINGLELHFELGLCCDCAVDQKEVIRSAYALTDYFDYLIFSCDVIWSKNDEAFYALMLQNGRFTPADCLLIDDTLANTDFAGRLGFQTYTYRDPETLREFLTTVKP